MEPMSDREASPEDLKRALEWELSLDNNDLRSHAWYHGTIPRPRAEELMSGEGDFLIRDCISRPGDYVLTCRWKGTSLHFVINKVVFQPFTVYEKIQYQFEDDCFDTVPDLVTFYVGNKRTISAASGAVISKPVNRSMPLSYYASRYGLECQMHYAALEKVSQIDENSTIDRRHSDTTHPAEESHSVERRSSSPPLSVSGDYPSLSTEADAKQRSNEETVLIKKDDTPPPKPSRIPSKKYYSTTKQNITSGNNTPSGPHLYSELNFVNNSSNGNIQKPDNVDWSNGIKFGNVTDHLSTREMTLPEVNPPSSFNLDAFTTVLLPSENKPLDPSALAKMRCMIMEGGARVIAGHLTKVDLEVLKLNQSDIGMTGFELIVLPQGQQLRLDLLERTECLKFFVAVTILTCGDEEIRAQVLNKWIQIAIETKTALGNLLGFTGIMQGLALQQISRLRCTWLKLRQTYTENAFTYETKLRPTIKNMQECTNPQAPNTCIPYMLSLIDIQHKHLSYYQEEEDDNTTSLSKKEKGKILSLGLPWEQTAADYGLQLLLTHLEMGRAITQQWPMYKRNSEIVLEHVKYDDLMLDMFKTEFQMKFLWGSKGSHVFAKERYDKFMQVLNVMSERCEAD